MNRYDFSDKKAAIVGLGLIGGSFAKALTKQTGCTVIGIDTNTSVIDSALSDGVITREGTPGDMADADFIILCLYPSLTVDFMRQYSQFIPRNAVVLDTCGIKSAVCKELEPISDRYGFIYIGGHPMAGREQGGYNNSLDDLFKGASFIFTPRHELLNNSRYANALEQLKQLMLIIGFGRITVTTPQNHDAVIAYTSQIPHVLACAYMFSPRCLEHSGYSAGSYKDVSRVALINEELWSDAFLSNSDALTSEIDELINNLEIIRQTIKAGDKDKLRLLLKKAREIKQRYG